MKQKKILITGLHGFIGSRFAQLADRTFKIIDCGRPDITKSEQVKRAVGRDDVEVVLHLAAKTHIDPCEEDRRYGMEGEAWVVNVIGTQNISQACKKYDKYLLFLSTECVFDGEKGNYKETDTPNPKNWYGETKYYAEQEILLSGAKACILRSVLTYGHPDPFRLDFARFVITRLRENKKIKAVSDQYIDFTFIDDLVSAILQLITKETKGIYHFSSHKSYTPYAFACMIKEHLQLQQSLIIPISLQEFFGKSAKLRLRNSTLNSNKFFWEFGWRAINLRQYILSHSRPRIE